MFRRSCAVAVLVLLTAQLHAAEPALEMTEARNAAVGFAATHQLVMAESLVRQCAMLEGMADAADQAYRGWDARNSTVSRAAWSYLTLAGDAIAAQQGEEAVRKFHDDRKAEFGTHARESLRVLFKDGAVDMPACQKIVDAVNDGVMDIRNNQEFHETLLEIDASISGMEKNDQQTP